MLKLSKNFEKGYLTLYGFFSTMPILTLFDNTWFTWMTIVFVIYVIVIKRTNLKIHKTFYFAVFACSIISAMVCLFTDMPDYWHNIQPKNVMWEVLFLVVFIYFYKNRTDTDAIYFIKGVYFAAIFQMCWGVLQFVFYSMFQISINQVIFGDFLHMQTRMLTQYKGNSIALSGMCWNVGNLAPLIVIGYSLTNSMILKIAFLCFSVISGSRTMLLGMVASVAVECIISVVKRKKKIKLRHVLVIVSFFVLGIVTLLCINPVRIAVFDKVNDLMQAFSKASLTTQSSARVHARYWTTIPRVTQWSGVIHSLFGYGLGCSGYPFSVLLNQYVGEEWSVECDYISKLWSTGYVGFVVFYTWLGSQIMKAKKINPRFLVLFGGILAEGITYNVMFNWCTLTILLLIALVSLKRDPFNELANIIGHKGKRIITNNAGGQYIDV